MARLSPLLLALPLLLSALATPALAQTITDGESLRERCRLIQLTDPTAGRQCQGYIGAVADIMAAGHRLYEWSACPPASTERYTLTKKVKSWIKENPDELKAPAFVVIARALSISYPCDGG